MTEDSGADPVGDREAGGPASVASPPAHRASHRALLRRCGPESHRAVDVIVVPASRPPEHLLSALGLGATLQCPVVVLCSKVARAKEVAGLAAETPGARCVAVDLPAAYDHRLVRFTTSSCKEAVVGRLRDLGLKRNLGILLARLVGWRSVLFLDDDMREVNPTTVRRAASALGRFTAVGMAVHDFPDNSVVCHAHRLGGGKQDVFVTGSALVVECRKIDTFFPQIYNEDWLYLMDGLCRRRVARTGSAKQLAYRPFADPNRAAGEEFGDILAEGLVGLLHHGVPPEKATADYWDEFLLRRKCFIDRTATRLAALPRSAEVIDALNALEAAEQRRAEISAVLLDDYVRAWHADLRSWYERLHVLSRVGSVGAALQHLGLAEAALFSDSGPQRAARLSPPSTVSVAARPQPSHAKPARPSLVAARIIHTTPKRPSDEQLATTVPVRSQPRARLVPYLMRRVCLLFLQAVPPRSM
jgi:hypothetical protein